jgi:hypothetical protein
MTQLAWIEGQPDTTEQRFQLRLLDGSSCVWDRRMLDACRSTAEHLDWLLRWTGFKNKDKPGFLVTHWAPIPAPVLTKDANRWEQLAEDIRRDFQGGRNDA